MPNNGDNNLPAPPWRTVLSSGRTGLVLGLVLFLFAVSSLFTGLVHSRSALITADPYSYLLFAQELAQGHLPMTGPLAEAIAHFAENNELMQGPIWNTNVLPDGRTLFTIALGYPLFLSLALKIGGTWLYTKINVALLLLVVLALTWCVWEGWDRTLDGFLIGAAAGILFIHSHPATFLQFSNPWREPLFYFCLLGGMGGLIRFLRGGRILNLALAGLLLGYACAIKEANAIYVAWFGLYLLASGTWRRHPRRFRALAVFVGCGLLGITPLLAQNLVATGNPLLSTQFMRATSHYGLQEAAPGLNRNNLGNTVSRYLFMYRSLPWFHPIFILVALTGIVSSLKRPAMRLFAGVFAVHLALYLQWGNADFRHSLFAHIPYCLFVVAGAVWLLQLPLRRMRGAAAYRYWPALVPLFGLAALPPPWPATPSGERAFQHPDAVTLIEALKERTGADSVLLANRVLRDVIGVYGDVPVIRLHDLVVFNPTGDYAPVIDWLREQGREVYFLDNRDLEPRNVGVIRWDKMDYGWLLDRYDLSPVSVLDSAEYRIGRMTGGDPLTIYRVDAWRPGPGRRSLVVPDEGASFLFLNPRSAANLRYRLNGVPFVPDPIAGYYQPAPPLPPGSTAVFEWEGEGAVPDLYDLRFVTPNETIRQECAADAVPDDQYVFPQGGLAAKPENCRRFSPPMVIRIPVRQDPNLFTTVGLGLNLYEGETNRSLFVTMPDGEPMPITVTGSAAWFPAVLPEDTPRGGRTIDVTLSADAEASLKMNRIKSIPARRSLRRTLAPDQAGIALVGRIVPDIPGQGPHSWTATINGSPALSGRCFDDPRRSLNAFHSVIPNPGSPTDWRIAFQGGGLINFEWVPVTDRLDILPGNPHMAFVSSGVFPAEQVAGEHFCWTEAQTRVQVPVGASPDGYLLVMRAADGHPGRPRTLQIRFAGQSQQVDIPQTPDELTLHFHPTAAKGPGLRELTLEIPSWSPREVLGFEDDRALGFMLYSLTWEPVK